MRLLRGALLAGVLFIVALGPGQSVIAQQSPSKSVFRLDVMVHEIQGPYRSGYHSVAAGTAFFISSDGTALTNSHVVYWVRANPVKYQLLATMNEEFYGATLVCSSQLPEDPTKPTPQGVHPSRDLAEIRLTPSRFPFDQLLNGDIPYARAHSGPIPKFPALTLGGDPTVGDAIRVLGFGRTSTSPLPYEWSAEGTVNDIWKASDGTALFGIRFSHEAEPGHSGSPVLNAMDQVVGIYTWHKFSDPTQGTAQGVSGLLSACP